MPTGEFVRRVLIVAAVAVGIVLFWVLRNVLVSAFLSVIIAAGITLPTRALQQWGMRASWALGISIALVTAGVLALFVLVVPSIAVQLGELLVSAGKFVERLVTAYNQAQGNDFLAGLFPSLEGSTALVRLQQAIEASRPEEPASAWLLGNLAVPALEGFGLAVGWIVNLALLWLIGIWFAVDPRSHLNAGLFLFPRARHARVREVWAILGDTLQTWLKAQFTSIGITVALVYVILGLVLDLPYTLVVAVFAGIATFVPNIGAFLPLIPITIFGLTSDTPQRLLVWIAVYLAIQLVESNFITPLVVKVQLEIPAGALMVFQLIATVLFGPLGLLLAVPMLAVLIVLVRELYSYDALGLQDLDLAEDQTPRAAVERPAALKPAP